MLDKDVEWEIIVDSNLGTYSLDKNLLPQLKALLLYNFMGVAVYVLDWKDPQLMESCEACWAYVLNY